MSRSSKPAVRSLSTSVSVTETVTLKWPTGGLPVKLSPAMSCQATSDGATWEPVEIRGVQGCEWTNEAGLYFAKWTEGAANFKYSSFDITGAEAREMLADWEPLG